MAKDLFANLGSTGASNTDESEAPKTNATSASQTSGSEAQETPKTSAPAQTATPAPKAPAAPAEEPEEKEPTELDILKGRAKMMGIAYADNVTVDELKEKITAKLNGTDVKPEAPARQNNEVITEETSEVKTGPKKTLRQLLYEENMRLIRVRVTNLDPNDKDLHGQVYSVSNEYIGTVSKFIPFGEATDNGYHIPYCLYKFIKNMKFLQIKTVGKGQKARTETSWVRKFALEELPQLTDKEIAQLAASQLGRGAIDE